MNRSPRKSTATRGAVIVAALSLLLAGCTDRPVPTETGVMSAGAGRARDETFGRDRIRLVADFGADVPLAYYQLSLDFSKHTAGFTPPVQSRAYAYMGLALYEALVGGMPDHRPIAPQLNGVGALPTARGIPYHWPLVANAALAEVMRGLWGDRTNRAANNIADLDALEARFAAQYAEGVPPGLAMLSSAFGRAVGAAVFETSKDDGAHESYLTNFPTTYTPPEGPGLWVPLPGQLAMQPYWGTTVQPFTLSNAAECDPGAPPAYSEEPGSPFYTEAAEIYELSKTQTPEQATIARFWADGPGTISGPGHSLAIASEILGQQGANQAVAAETYARAGIADADAVTAIWWVKYHYNLIRPVTVIQRVIDASWLPLLNPTPPFPEYVSAHSGQSSAALASLEDVFGEHVAFVDHAHDTDGFAPRSFDHIFAAAEEAGFSRMYAGIHFRSGNLEGLALGRCVAARVNALRWRADDDGRTTAE